MTQKELMRLAKIEARREFARAGGKARAQQKERPEVSAALRGYWQTPAGMARRRKPVVAVAPAADPANPVGNYQP